MRSEPLSAHQQALRFYGQILPRLVRALKPGNILSDPTRRARRLRNPPRRWAHPPPGFPPAHRHPQFELCFVLAGRCPFLLGEERFLLRRGALVVLPPEVYHRELAADRCGPYQVLWLTLQRHALGAHLQDHRGNGRFNRQAFRIWLQDFPHGLEIGKNVDWELWQARPGNFHRVQGLLLELCGFAERSLDGQRRPAPVLEKGEALQRWRIEAAVEYVRDHFSHPLDLAEVAQHAGISPGYLSALFTRTLGHSFTAYLAACRLEEARRLLADPALSIKEIARRVGIENPLYFSRLFRNATGRSPKHYRQQLALKAPPGKAGLS